MSIKPTRSGRMKPDTPTGYPDKEEFQQFFNTMKKVCKLRGDAAQKATDLRHYAMFANAGVELEEFVSWFDDE